MLYMVCQTSLIIILLHVGRCMGVYCQLKCCSHPVLRGQFTDWLFSCLFSHFLLVSSYLTIYVFSRARNFTAVFSWFDLIFICLFIVLSGFFPREFYCLFLGRAWYACMYSIPLRYLRFHRPQFRLPASENVRHHHHVIYLEASAVMLLHKYRSLT